MMLRISGINIKIYQQSHPNGESDDNDDGDNDDGMMVQLMGSMFDGGTNNMNQPSQSSGNNNSGQDEQKINLSAKISPKNIFVPLFSPKSKVAAAF